MPVRHGGQRQRSVPQHSAQSPAPRRQLAPGPLGGQRSCRSPGSASRGSARPLTMLHPCSHRRHGHVVDALQVVLQVHPGHPGGQGASMSPPHPGRPRQGDTGPSLSQTRGDPSQGSAWLGRAQHGTGCPRLLLTVSLSLCTPPSDPAVSSPNSGAHKPHTQHPGCCSSFWAGGKHQPGLGTGCQPGEGRKRPGAHVQEGPQFAGHAGPCARHPLRLHPLPSSLALLHGDLELHSVLRLRRARTHQPDEEIGPKYTELGAPQLVQGVPTQDRLGSQ